MTAFEITWDWEDAGRDWEDVVRGEWGDWYVLRWGDEVLWREPAFWEDYETFLTVADVLRRKYGPRLKDVVPSGSAESNMWADRLSAPSWIEEARRRVRAGLQVLCIDIDDMVADFEAAVARLSDDDARDYAGRLDEVPGIWYRVPPRPNAIEAIRRLSASTRSAC